MRSKADETFVIVETFFGFVNCKDKKKNVKKASEKKTFFLHLYFCVKCGFTSNRLASNFLKTRFTGKEKACCRLIWNLMKTTRGQKNLKTVLF